MTLRRKSLLIHLFSMLILLLLLDYTFTGFLRFTAEQTERERMERNLARAVVSINGEAQTLSAITGNWAFSDATWNYMHGTNPGYADTTLNRDVLTEIGVSSMIFVDTNYDIKLFKDFSAENEPSPPEMEFATIVEERDAASLFEALGTEGISGIAMQDDEPMLYSVRPILTSDMAGPPAGYLIATRGITPSLILSISNNISFNFAVEPVTPEEKKLGEALPLIDIQDSASGPSSTLGRMLVRDHSGEPSFWVRGISQKDDVSTSEKTLQRLFLIFGVISLVFCVFCYFLFNKFVSHRLARLQSEIEATRDETGKSITVDNKKDEITSLQRVLNDSATYHEFKQEHKDKLDGISLMVYERYAQAGNRLCYGTLKDIATAFTPRDENFRKAIPRAADMMDKFCNTLDMGEEETFYAHMGSLFNRIGLLGLPFSLRNKSVESYTPQELRDYQKYPEHSKDILEAVELLRPASQLPYSWNENWDGTGFPKGLSGSAIPLAARAFAIVDAWNELTRPWPGRRLPSAEDVETKLRDMAGTRLDPHLTEKFIQLLAKLDREEKE